MQIPTTQIDFEFLYHIEQIVFNSSNPYRLNSGDKLWIQFDNEFCYFFWYL